ncbi:hypothetical protein NMY22_g17969 [Coprinellus aureogranulatus]|nr:hypothetical protein NMY22_g17969 [Coprinellus aureogranulatus]
MPLVSLSHPEKNLDTQVAREASAPDGRTHVAKRGRHSQIMKALMAGVLALLLTPTAQLWSALRMRRIPSSYSHFLETGSTLRALSCGVPRQLSERLMIALQAPAPGLIHQAIRVTDCGRCSHALSLWPINLPPQAGTFVA